MANATIFAPSNEAMNDVVKMLKSFGSNLGNVSTNSTQSQNQTQTQSSASITNLRLSKLFKQLLKADDEQNTTSNSNSTQHISNQTSDTTVDPSWDQRYNELRNAIKPLPMKDLKAALMLHLVNGSLLSTSKGYS